MANLLAGQQQQRFRKQQPINRDGRQQGIPTEVLGTKVQQHNLKASIIFLVL